jgi:hypothetical protein
MRGVTGTASPAARLAAARLARCAAQRDRCSDEEGRLYALLAAGYVLGTCVRPLTGPGVPASYTMSVAPGKSVSHTFVGTGCAHWTVRVASVNGTVIHAAGNPNLENGATHKC